MKNHSVDGWEDIGNWAVKHCEFIGESFTDEKESFETSELYDHYDPLKGFTIAIH
jgi:hypothetical protein